MPLLKWTAFVEARSQAHLVVAAVDDELGVQTAAQPGGDRGVRTLLELLKRLLRKLGVEGDYAATIARTPQGAEICFAFERLADADRLAEKVDAAPSTTGATWASARRFVLDPPAVQRLEAVAGPPQSRRRR